MSALRNILLATDLGSRSDRAMDRAMWLMKQYESELLALHVLEPNEGRTELDSAEMARRRLGHYLRDADRRVRVCIERGAPAEVILRFAAEETPSLVISGVARDQTLGQVTLGRTVDHLLRDSPAPLLIVTDRPHGPYQNIVVATDFSDGSLETLAVAATLFPGQPLTLFHAFDVPRGVGASDLDAHREALRQAAHQDCQDFLAKAPIADEARALIEPLIECGDPDRLLSRLAHRAAVDLVVLATHGRGRILGALYGEVAKRILMLLPCDALVLRA